MPLANFTRYANLLDWTLGFGCVGYGLYAGNAWWIAGGVLGLAIAAVNPTKRLTARIQAKVAANPGVNDRRV